MMSLIAGLGTAPEKQSISSAERFNVNVYFISIALYLIGLPRSCDKVTPSLPEYSMEFCKATLTFESAYEILRYDHSNESSLSVLSHDAICLSKF